MKKYLTTLFLISFLLTNVVFGQENKIVMENEKVKAVKDDLDYRLNNLVQQISDGLTENQKQRIAVVEFVDLESKVTNFGRYLAEELITRLYQTKKFKVIERNLLAKIISEQKLSLTGVIDPTSAQKLGKLLGVDAIASGSVSDLGKTFKVNARLINTETGEIFGVASTEVVKDDAVCALSGCLTENQNEQRIDKPLNTSKIEPKKEEYKTQKSSSMNLDIELKLCKRNFNSVVCEFTVVNNNKERYLNIYAGPSDASPRIFDDLNNEYRAKWVNIANRGKRDISDEISIVTGIPSKVAVEFENVDKNTTKLTLVQFHGYIKETKGFVFQTDPFWFQVNFKDVPISNK